MIAQDVVKAVISLLSGKGRLELLPEVAEGLTRAAFTQVDPHLATVTSSRSLSAMQKSALTKTLSQVFSQPVRLKTKLDPDLIGGLRISLAGRVIDLSLDKQLTDMQEAIIYD